MKILLLQLRRLGDLILTTPAIEAVRAQFPQAKITLAVARACEPLLPAIRNVDQFLITRRGLRDLGAWVEIRRGCFDAVVDFTRNDRSAWLTLLSGAKQRVTSEESPLNFKRRAYTDFAAGSLRNLHTIDFDLAQLAPLGIRPESADPILALPAAAQQSASSMIQAQWHDEPFAIFHPCSARIEKFWEPERWAEVITFAARELGLRPVLSGGSSLMEQNHLAAIRAKFNVDVLDLSVDLLTLAALIERARLLVTVDTAPMHLAAALRTPQVALFGPTNPFHWRPRNDRTTIVFGATPLTQFDPNAGKQPMRLISTAAVIDAMRSMLNSAAAFTPPAPNLHG
ncbi:MAG: glycosyltransferase family 9 protein [Verrucomicrobiota bacterium]|nr:glycosyltransferase family 9 protein [Verrucomicrobiota bacterium]